MSKMTNIVKLSLNSKTITDEVNGIAETLETQTDAIKQINNGVELNRIIDGHNQQ
jgi:methyl-accepting chemotaxis protein